MTANRFGGRWTRDKLKVLQEYLQFYCKAMSKQPYYKLIYIDAFAGTGRCKIREKDGDHRVIDGSAKIALDCDPGFHEFRFIEKKKIHQEELVRLINSHPNGEKATINPRSAEDLLPSMLSVTTGKSIAVFYSWTPLDCNAATNSSSKLPRLKPLTYFF